METIAVFNASNDIDNVEWEGPSESVRGTQEVYLIRNDSDRLLQESRRSRIRTRTTLRRSTPESPLALRLSGLAGQTVCPSRRTPSIVEASANPMNCCKGHSDRIDCFIWTAPLLSTRLATNGCRGVTISRDCLLGIAKFHEVKTRSSV